MDFYSQDSELKDRVNKCPKSLTSPLYAEPSYTEVQFPVTLNDIFDGNDVDEVIEKSSFYEEMAMNETEKFRPSLWFRSAYDFDMDCETSNFLSREEALQDLIDLD